MSQRQPPHDHEAELSLIGAILRRPQIMRDLAPLMDASDFFDPNLQHIYAAIMELYTDGRSIDTVTVKAENPTLIEYRLLEEAQNTTPSVSAFARYADIVIEASRKRRVIKQSAELIERAYDPASDIDLVLAEHGAGADRLIGPRSADIPGLSTFADFMAAQKLIADNRPWLLPHIFKAMWRVIVVAGEGGSKSVTMRQLAVNAAAGRDPWDVHEFIPPLNVLVADFENPGEAVSEQLMLANQLTGIDIIDECEDRLHIFHREGGVNLRDRRPLAEFEAVLQRTRPQIVFAGPLYKMFRRPGREDLEQAALESITILDDLRVRYGFALMLEHHAPKGSGLGYRDLSPFGSAVWQRWPEIGLTFEPDQPGGNPGDQVLDLRVGRFRPDRVVCQWPSRLSRGRMMQSAAWIPSFAERRWAMDVPS